MTFLNDSLFLSFFHLSDATPVEYKIKSRQTEEKGIFEYGPFEDSTLSRSYYYEL